MSEKRFKLQHINDLTDQEYMRLKKITDNGELITLGEVVDLLNEQQATITHLEKVNGKNFAKRRLLEQDNLVLRNENEQLRKELKNRSAFIVDKGLGDTFIRWKNE